MSVKVTNQYGASMEVDESAVERWAQRGYQPADTGKAKKAAATPAKSTAKESGDKPVGVTRDSVTSTKK